MPNWLQILIVSVIVIVAVSFIGRVLFYEIFGCGCGCGGSEKKGKVHSKKVGLTVKGKRVR